VYISHYTQFAKYLHTLGFKAFIPERPIDDKTYIPYVFSEEEMIRLFSAADNLETQGKPSLPNLQFPIILRILYGCGLRLEEALGLEISDVDLDAQVLLIRNAKGNKDRLVPMDGTLSGILRQYISMLIDDRPESGLLFMNGKKARIAGATIRYWFVRTLAAAGIEKPDLPRYSRNICAHCISYPTINKIQTFFNKEGKNAVS
jgi:site-specific recombinase XerD